MTQYILGAALAAFATALVGIAALILRGQRKQGQKQAEAEYAQQQAINAKEAGAIVAEQRPPSATVDRLRGGTF